MAFVEAKHEGIWLKGLTSNMVFFYKNAIIFYDSLNATCLAKDKHHLEQSTFATK